MTMKKRERDQAPDAVPAFADLQEAADFWDSHSPLDFPDDFEEAEIRISRVVRDGRLTVDLDRVAFDRLREVASREGIDPSALARSWILEHLNLPRPEPTSPTAR